MRAAVPSFPPRLISGKRRDSEELSEAKGPNPEMDAAGRQAGRRGAVRCGAANWHWASAARRQRQRELSQSLRGKKLGKSRCRTTHVNPHHWTHAHPRTKAPGTQAPTAKTDVRQNNSDMQTDTMDNQGLTVSHTKDTGTAQTPRGKKTGPVRTSVVRAASSLILILFAFPHLPACFPRTPPRPQIASSFPFLPFPSSPLPSTTPRQVIRRSSNHYISAPYALPALPSSSTVLHRTRLTLS